MLEHKRSELVKKREIIFFFRQNYQCLGYASPHQPHSPGDLHKHKAEGTSPPDTPRTSHQTGRVTA